MELFNTIATVALGVLALVPLTLLLLHRARRNGLRLLVGTLFCALAVGFGWAVHRSQGAASFEPPVLNRPIEVPSEGYVSSRTCRACHPSEHATWHASYHRSMTQIASPESVVGDFDNVELSLFGVDYHLTRQDDHFFVEVEPDDDTPQQPSGRRRIVMTTGSHHRQWVWMETGESRNVQSLPFLYLINKQRWVPLHASFLMPPSVHIPNWIGAWNDNCIRCHTTQGRSRPQRPGAKAVVVDTHVGEFGIACESCHGPGREHIEANRDPWRRYKLRASGQADPTIANPARMSARKSSQVCGQCHSVLTPYKYASDIDRFYQHGFSYRPGDELSDTRFFPGHESHQSAPEVRKFLDAHTHFLGDRFWSDGMVRLAGREYSGLMITPCHTHGDESSRMSCLSCHSLHQQAGDSRGLVEWTDDQLKPNMRDNHACLQCHDDYSSDDLLQAHTHHAPTSSGSVCYNCHMSYTTFGLLKAIRSHTIDSPNVEASLQTGRPNACNQCHLDKTLAWTAEFLESRYGIAQPRLTEDEQTIAAAILWSLSGDAGQRALMAWTMSWQGAHDALTQSTNPTGTQWLIPYLAPLLKDPYTAVRYLAQESLASFGELAGTNYDFLAPVANQTDAARRVLETWKRKTKLVNPSLDETSRGPLLLENDGSLQMSAILRLLENRDNKRVSLQE